MMSVKNSTASSDLTLLIGHALIHLENLSIASSRCVKPPGAFLSSSTMSSPHK
jgi:hypothetical protein